MRSSLLVLVLVASNLHAAPVEHREDAALHGVFFVDAKEGWSVGDDGVIRHSIDGGKSWQDQTSGTLASLRGVYFLDESIGWVVGREERPFVGGSVGVLLFTRNGGLRWQRLLDNSLPGLNAVRFADRNTGLLLGDGVDPFASGLFRTMDGGKSWQPVPGTRTAAWTGGDFQDGKTGILAGPMGKLATLRNDTWAYAEHEVLAGRSIGAVRILRDRVVAAGEGGLVLTSATGGAAWGFADVKMPAGARSCVDFQAIASVDDHAWLAGRPGSVILTTTDSGATWTPRPTGQPLPIRGLHFVDKKIGWAVGVAGLVLRTEDGGVTWSNDNQPKRAPVLAVSARADAVPLDMLAHLGGVDGYHAAAYAVTSDDVDSAAARMPDRLHAAVRKVGGLAGERTSRFPLPAYLDRTGPQPVLVQWNKLHGGQAPVELLRQLVLTLRMWRPDVVLTDPADGTTAEALVAEAMVEAVKQSGDPTAFPEQIETLGLAAWKVRSLYGRSAHPGGRITDNMPYMPALEGSVRDFVTLPMALLTDDPLAAPSQRSYRLLAGDDPSGHLLSGATAPVGIARREASKVDAPASEQFLVTRQVANLLEKMPTSEALLTQLPPMLAKLSEDQAAHLAFRVAGTCARQGEWDLAREVYLVLVDRCPSHPLSAEAYRWLLRHNTSSEARRRTELKQFTLVRGPDTIDVDKLKPPSGLPTFTKSPIQQTAAILDSDRLGTIPEIRQWRKGADPLVKHLAGFGPIVVNDPAVQFQLQSARRSLGDVGVAREWYTRYAAFVPKGPWHEAAVTEAWLVGAAAKPRRLAYCRFTERRPHLDGKLDDACWTGQTPMLLTDAAGGSAKDSPTEVWLAYDPEYLYLAVRCKHAVGQRVPPVKNRGRDADLDAFDRVSLMLDLDRDYASYFHLQIDQRGCCREDCTGDVSWNPKWFVAVESTEDSWSAEVAIPLGELTSEPITVTDTRWVCNLTRVLPGRGVQSFSQPAGVRPRPEGMCGLIFSQSDSRKAAPMQTAP
jgi:photosystem II stability/assembly factor-like uncharacterized protein